MKQYEEYLKNKIYAAMPNGFEPYELNDNLFDWQQDLTIWAIKKGRSALFEDCGLGKTLQQLVWAENVCRHTSKPVLILAPLAVSQQTKREGLKFGIDVNICRDQSDVKIGINITNYEKLDKFHASEFGGVVLDESSIIKNFAGKIRNQIIDCFRGTPYKLACTATPAPNDHTELGNTAEFLGVITRTEMLSMFFINDTGHTGTWRLKGHVKNNLFWKWLGSWAVVMRKPSDIGYPDGDFILPELNMVAEVVPYNGPKKGLLGENAATLSEVRQAMRESLPERVERAANLANSTDEQFIMWCNLDEESARLTKSIKGSVEVKGSNSQDHKEKAMLSFSDGNIKCIVTKPRIGGFGLNWQNCHNMAFVGLSYSYEQLYQAIRRCWRFGQKETVNVYVITGEREGNVVKNIERKEKNAAQMYSNMVKQMKMKNFKDENTSQKMSGYKPKTGMKIPDFLLQG